MTKFLPSLFLASAFFVQPLSASEVFKEVLTDVTNTTPRLVINDDSKGPQAILHEKELLIAGVNLIKQNNCDQALECFEKAISQYGSPLGYLYAAPFQLNEGDYQRYMTIAYYAVQGGALSQKLYKRNVEFLIDWKLL